MQASDDYSVSREGRKESVGGLVREQNRLRDLHAEMDVIPSFHPTYPSLLHSELEAVNNMHACLFDVHQHDRSDHHQYLQLCSALRLNLEAERESERRARGVLIAGVLVGLGCGMVLVFMTSQASNYFTADHIGDSLIYSYNTKKNSADLFTDCINSHHMKIAAFLAEVSNELQIKRVGVDEEVMEKVVEVGEVGEMVARNKGVGKEMRRVIEALKRHSLPVLEVQQGDRMERGLWITTLTYSCAAILVPIIACCFL